MRRKNIVFEIDADTADPLCGLARTRVLDAFADASRRAVEPD